MTSSIPSSIFSRPHDSLGLGSFLGRLTNRAAKKGRLSIATACEHSDMDRETRPGDWNPSTTCFEASLKGHVAGTPPRNQLGVTAGRDRHHDSEKSVALFFGPPRNGAVHFFDFECGPVGCDLQGGRTPARGEPHGRAVPAGNTTILTAAKQILPLKSNPTKTGEGEVF